MEPNTQLLHSVWDNTDNFFTKKNTELDSIRLEEILSSFFCSGPFYFFVIDFFDLSLSNVSSTVKEIHGLDPSNTKLEDILSLMHPEDMDFVAKAEDTVISTLYKTLGLEKLKNYKMSYCFRMKIADGSYRLFHHQAITLSTDENGGLGKSLNVHVDISHITTINNYKPSLIGMFGEPSFLNLNISSPAIITDGKKGIFTNREKQIIQFMTKGLTNTDIANQLFLSVHTVKTHRKNIFKKAECKNLGQLITMCVSEGLI